MSSRARRTQQQSITREHVAGAVAELYGGDDASPCADCHAELVVRRHPSGTVLVEIGHSDGCPWLRCREGDRT